MLIYKISSHCTVKGTNKKKKLSSWLIAIIMDKTFRQIHFPTSFSGSLKTETSLMTGTNKSSWCLSFFTHWPKMNYKNPPSRVVTCRILTIWIIVYGRLKGNVNRNLKSCINRRDYISTTAFHTKSKSYFSHILWKPLLVDWQF